MAATYFVTSEMKLRTPSSERGFPTVESTLRAADGILGKSAGSVWIVDRDGTLFLPADQVTARLSPVPLAPTDP